MLGQYQAETKKEYLPGFMNDGSERIGQNTLKGDATFPDRCDDPDEPGFGQNNARGGFGDVGGGRDCDPNLGLARKRFWRIVGANPSHMPTVWPAF